MSQLTETRVRNAKPEGKPRKIFDERGLYLLVKPNGTKAWRLKYRIHGTEKLLALGLYPDVGLRKARDRRDEARKLIADGKDPSEERKAERLAGADTFRLIADEYLELQAKTLAEETISIHRGRLHSVLYPAFGNKPITAITAPNVLSVLKAVEARGNSETAHRLRALVSRVFRYAVATGRAEHDVTASLRGALAPVKTTNFAAITTPQRIAELLRAIDGYCGQPSAAYALRLAPLVFTRPGELRWARWSEFDLDAAEWRIPAERMKMSKPHFVPLATQAVAILRELQELTGDGELLFPGLRDPNQPISDGTLNAALRRLGFSQTEHTAHGFRSMASTCLNEQGWHPDLIELQLAHTPQDQVRAAYNRSQRLEERRRMMQGWADYLSGLKSGAAVIPIRKVAAVKDSRKDA